MLRADVCQGAARHLHRQPVHLMAWAGAHPDRGFRRQLLPIHRRQIGQQRRRRRAIQPVGGGFAAFQPFKDQIDRPLLHHNVPAVQGMEFGQSSPGVQPDQQKGFVAVALHLGHGQRPRRTVGDRRPFDPCDRILGDGMPLPVFERVLVKRGQDRQPLVERARADFLPRHHTRCSDLETLPVRRLPEGD